MQITMLELTDIIIHAYLKGQRDLEKATDNTKLVDAVVSHCQEQTVRQRHLRNVDKSLDEDTLTSFKKNPEPHKYEPLSSSESNICKWCNNPWNSKIHGTFGGEPIPDKAVDETGQHKFEPIVPNSKACKFCDHPWNARIHIEHQKPKDHEFNGSYQYQLPCTICGQPYNSVKHLPIGTVRCKSTHEYHPCARKINHVEDHFYDTALKVAEI